MIRFLQILGGLALFMYGARMLSSGMEKLQAIRSKPLCNLERSRDHADNLGVNVMRT
jgi:hypothetical protein